MGNTRGICWLALSLLLGEFILFFGMGRQLGHAIWNTDGGCEGEYSLIKSTKNFAHHEKFVRQSGTSKAAKDAAFAKMNFR
jgi:hypothetical protein